jgi:hypothetical protein
MAMSNDEGGWRTLTPGELAAEPEAGFGGTIASLFGLALLALAPLPIVMFVWGTTPVDLVREVLTGSPGPFSRMADSIGVRTAIYFIWMTVWGTAFVVVTVLRLRSGPKITANLLYLTASFPLAIRLGAIISRWEFQTVPLSEVPLLIMGLVAAVAYQAYMDEGRRPNLYFRRRVRI